MLLELRLETKKCANPSKAKLLSGYFKTGKGEYGEGDIFYGLTVPVSRAIAKKYFALPLTDIGLLLTSKIHEERLIALLILVEKYQKADSSAQKEIYHFYLQQTKYINNWDLVDLSSPKIVGAYVLTNRTEEKKLLQLVTSDNLWERRIAMLAAFAYVGAGETKFPLQLADVLLYDKHDLIQKAVGWMLREIGKRVSRDVEKVFLKTRYQTMPRTMLRYAIEHFPPEERQRYLKGEI